jgi:DNA repair exonuclease SbcCD ATPase subunit
MEITGMLAWGNGEPCPICGKPFEKADFKHLLTEHRDELNRRLFPEG